MADFVPGYYPKEEAIYKFVENIKQDTKPVINSLQHPIADRHNTFTNYVVSLLLFATGHRPVTDPFCYLMDIDLDNGWLLIDDKVVAESRRFRLASLPEIARKQLQHYLDHLRDLATLLQKRKGPQKAMGHTIGRLFSGNRNQILPLFFHLSEDLTHTRSITRESILQLWSNYWPAPANFGRRFIATELGRLGINAQMVRIQLGHADSVDYPLGRNSTTIPRRVMEELSLHLDNIMASAGWEALPYRTRTRYKFSTTLPKDISIHGIHSSPTLGPEHRYRDRMNRLKQDKSIVQTCIADLFPRGIPDHPEPEQLDQLVVKVRKTAEAKKARTSRCLYFLYRELKRLRLRGKEFGSYRQAIVIPEEGSPFGRNTVSDYRLLLATRRHFIRYLADCQKQSPTASLELRLAELSISAAFFGRLAQKHLLDQLPEQTIQSVFHIEEWIFVDFHHDPEQGKKKRRQPEKTDPTYQPPAYRWCPDDLSRALLIGMRRLLAESPNNIDRKVLHREKSNLLKKLLPSSIKASARISTLLRLAEAAAIMELPGFLRTYVLGQRPHTPLPQSSLVRLFTEQQLVIDETRLQQLNPASRLWTPEITHANNDAGKKDAKAFLKALRREFSAAKSLPFKYNEGRNRKLRNALAEQLPDLISRHNWPVIASALSAWIFKLCKEGTDYKKNIAFSTVDNYAFTVANPMMQEACHINFLSLSEEEYEEIYLRALTYADREDVLTVATQLRSFHDHLTSNWPIEEPDWSVVFLEAGSLDTKNRWQADANIITELEYLRAIDVCLNDTTQPPLRRSQHIVLLLLGYRFFLRFGEAYKAQLRDIQTGEVLTENLMYFLTRNSIYGNLKTLAAVRHIPLVQQLTEKEHAALETVMTAAKDRSNGDIQAVLMAEGANPRNLIDRFEMSLYINRILRFVTGDPLSRYHHLRRSGVMKLMATACKSSSNDTWRSFSRKILGRGLVNTELVWAGNENHCKRLEDIAIIIGHVDADTTLAAYTHILDAMLLEFDVSNEYQITYNAWAWALGVTENTIKKRFARKSSEHNALIIPDLKQGLIPAPDVRTRPYGEAIRDSISNTERYSMSPLEFEYLLSSINPQQGNIAALSKQFGLQPEKLQQIIEKCKEVELASGYEGYLLNEFFYQNHVPQMTFPKPAFQNRRETENVRQFLQSLPEWWSADQNHNHQFSDLWISGHYPGLGYIYLPDVTAMEVVKNFLQKINLGNIGLQCIVHDPTNISPSISSYCRNKNIPIALNDKLSQKGIKSRSHHHIHVGCRFTNLRSPISTTKALNRVLFILSCHSNLI